MKNKMFFEEPELEVVRFDPKDAYIATSGCTGVDVEDDGCTGEDGCDDDSNDDF